MRKIITGEQVAQLYNRDPFALPAWRAPVYQTPAGFILLVQLARLIGWLVRLIARGPEESAVYAYLQQMADTLRRAADPTVRVLGPAPAPILKIRNLYRFHIQLRCPGPRPARLRLTATTGHSPARIRRLGPFHRPAFHRRQAPAARAAPLKTLPRQRS